MLAHNRAIASVCICLLSAELVRANDWPQFLGPNRNGVSGEQGLIDSWPAKGIKEVWRAKGGVGMSGLAVSRGRLITLVQNDGQQWLTCLSASTGESYWTTRVATEYKNARGDGPRATPTIEGDLVFAFTGEGSLVAANFITGNVLWSHNAVQELGGSIAIYGMASSPLVAGDLVIVTVGTPKACVAAYRTTNGSLAWAVGNDRPGFSSPALLQVGRRSQIVVFTGSSVLGLDPKSGTILWQYTSERLIANVAAPVALAGNVLVSAGDARGTVLLKLIPDGEMFKAEEVWESSGPRSPLCSEWQTPVVVDDKIFGLDNTGSGPVTHLVCLDATTGTLLWKKPRFGKSNLIAADHKLIFSTLDGELVLARSSPTAYEEIGRQTVIGPTRQSPSLADGLVYLRDDKEIVCLDLRR